MNNSNAYPLLAVDAGNTKTDVLAVGRDGTVVHWVQTGCGDIYGHEGEAAAVANVRRALEVAAGGLLESMHAERISFRLAGLDWPEDTALWTGVVSNDWSYGGEYTLANDGFAAIRLGSLDGVGLAITAGTGVALVARNMAGVEFGLNMWGPHDMGAKGLGIAGYRHVALQHLGMAPASALTERYTRFFGHADVAELVHSFTSRRRVPFKPLLATAAPLVTAAALEGDEVAQAIVNEQAELLYSYALSVAEKVGFARTAPVPVVLSGRVLREPGSPVTSILKARLQETFPQAKVRVAALPAVCGAALDVLAESGTDLSDAILRQMAQTMPATPEVV